MPNQQASHDLKRLHNAITDIDALSQHAFSEIAAVADLALHWMESPIDYRRLDVIANALSSISCRAQNTLESIGYEAESVGCGYEDPDKKRRLDAWETFRCGGSHA